MKKSPAKKPAKVKKVSDAPAENIAKAIVDALPGNEEPDESTLELENARESAKRRHIEARIKATGGKPPTQIEVWYDELAKEHVIKLDGVYKVRSETHIEADMRALGLSDVWKIDGQKEVAWPCWNARRNKCVDYAGPLPGYRIGLHEFYGRKVLVTKQAAGLFDKIDLKAKHEQPAFFIELIKALLPEFSQWERLCYRLATKLRAFQGMELKPAPFVLFVGKAGFCKSLIQDFITEIFGGRDENPKKGMLEKETFTAPLIRAEHWKFGDPQGGTDMKARLEFAARIKEYCHEIDFVFRGMHKEGFKVPCNRLVTGSENDDEADLQKYPPMRDGLADKIELYRCADARGVLHKFIRQEALPGFEAVDGVDRKAVRAAMLREAPLVRAWLLQNFPTVPADMADPRIGVKAWHHPELLKEMSELTPDTEYLHYVFQVLFRKRSDGDSWCVDWRQGPTNAHDIECGATELEEHLSKSAFAPQLKHQLRATARILGRLAVQRPDAVKKLKPRAGNFQPWAIFNPYIEATTKPTE